MQHLDEKETVQVLLENSFGCFTDSIFFVTSEALRINDEINECTLFVATEVIRDKLGLTLNSKPGDIDLLIIPEIENKVYFERTIAIEVKVLWPTNKKPEKNASKMGATQAKGLLTDGFPFVGLLHLAIPENSPSANKLEMPNGYLMDMFPLQAAARQQGRLNKLDIPEYVGFSSVGLQSLEADFTGISIGFEKPPKRNPNLNRSLVNDIRIYFESNRQQFTPITTFV